MQNPYIEMLRSGLSKAEPLLPFFIFAVVFVVALKALEAKFGGKKRKRWRGSSRWDRRGGNVRQFRPRHDALPDGAPDAADQLRTVMQAEFSAQRLLNKSEARLFRVLDQLVIDPSTGSGQDLPRPAGR